MDVVTEAYRHFRNRKGRGFALSLSAFRGYRRYASWKVRHYASAESSEGLLGRSHRQSSNSTAGHFMRKTGSDYPQIISRDLAPNAPNLSSDGIACVIDL